MDTNRSWAARRRAARKTTAKAICVVCGRPVFNRMVMDSTRGRGAAGRYAHQSCAARAGGLWERVW